MAAIASTGWFASLESVFYGNAADADTSTPMVEFTRYRDRPFLVNLDAANLEKVDPQKPEPGWASFDPVLAKKIITDNFDDFKRLTEDEKFKG